jgi:N-methylhydantoinase A
MDSAWLAERVEELRQNSLSTLESEGLPLQKIVHKVFLDLRYRGQDHTLKIPFSIKPTHTTLESLSQSFHQAYHTHSGYNLPDDPVELVTVRVETTSVIDSPHLAQLPETACGNALQCTRSICLDGDNYQEVDVYQRSMLAPEEHLFGPALVEEAASVTLVHPGQTLRVDGFGNLVIRTDVR